jgi:hypothetical protein
MTRLDIHEPHEFFQYIRLGTLPPVDRRRIDVALLDMNHSWPNMGHDSLVHAVLNISEELQDALVDAGLKVRVISFDVRRALQLPEAPDGRFLLYLGTGGPGHLDPRLNDGRSDSSQGIIEDPSWERPLFRLFDQILGHADASLFGVCHTFGLMCRWSGIAHPVLREIKSSGMPTNVLSREGLRHPWFSQFADALPDHRHYRVIDNRLFDLILDAPDQCAPLGYENEERTDAVTMMELARDRDGDMPRVLGVNHHPEIIDREHVMSVLQEKREHGEVTQRWYDERSHTLENDMRGDREQQSRLTSHFTLIAPMRYQLAKLIRTRRVELGYPADAAVAVTR